MPDKEFLIDLAFDMNSNKANGQGVDENDDIVNVEVQLNYEDLYPWKLQFDTDNGFEEHFIPALKFGKADGSINAVWRQEGCDFDYCLNGSINEKREVQFSLSQSNAEGPKR